jgi:hypothetical protein
VVELVDPLGNHERVVVGEGNDAGSQPDIARALGGGADKNFGRRNDFIACRMVLTDPSLIEAQRIEPFDELKISVEGRGGVLLYRVKRSEKNSETKRFFSFSGGQNDSPRGHSSGIDSPWAPTEGESGTIAGYLLIFGRGLPGADSLGRDAPRPLPSGCPSPPLAHASKESPMTDSARPPLPSGLVAFVKRDCPTCELVVPVLQQLADRGGLTIFSQDDPQFPMGMKARDDTELENSWRQSIDTVPTLVAVENGIERSRAIGWDRAEWETLTGATNLGSGLPDSRPGCGSLSVDPQYALDLAVRFGGESMTSRRVHCAPLEDEMEAAFDRGWTDGLPVVPPTERRVLAMLQGTSRKPDEVVAVVPPDLIPCTVEKVAINAVMAGCRPEYLPVVLAAVEAACTEQFNMHGLLATTMPAGPVIIVNGPIRRAIGMNSGGNVFGQGNRANATIGRALQLVIRNVGGGRPGEVDRAAFGNPGKLSFCFAEDEEGSPWGPLSADLGAEAGASTVTLFPGEGPRIIVDQLSREP